MTCRSFKTFVRITLIFSMGILFVSGAMSQDLGTKERPIYMLLVPCTEAGAMQAIGEKITADLYQRTGLYIVVNSLGADPATMIAAFTVSDGDTFGFPTADQYIQIYNYTNGNITPRLGRVLYGYPYYYSSIYARRDSDIKSPEDVDGMIWCYNYTGSTSGYVLPNMLFNNKGIALGRTVKTGGHTNSMAALIEGQCDFCTGYGSPPVPSAEWTGEKWAWGDDPEMWIWDGEKGTLYPEEERGTCTDLRQAVCRSSYYDLETVLSEIGVVANIGPIPNDCLAFGPDFPVDIADTIVAAIQDQFEDEAMKALWDDENFYEWIAVSEINDSYYDGYREILGLPIPERLWMRAAETITEALAIPEASEVFFLEGISPGTILREDGPTDEAPPVELKVPSSPGTYFTYYIDDEPWARFGHAVRYAWLNMDTGEHNVVDASWYPEIVQPRITPEPLEFVEHLSSAFTNFLGVKKSCYATGSTNSVSKKPLAGMPVFGVQTPCKKVALVIDCGDTDHGWFKGTLADNMAADADLFHIYLSGSGYSVQRISQYWGNTHAMIAYSSTTPLAMTKGLETVLKAYGTRLRCPCTGGAQHEFFLYINAHGQVNKRGSGYFTIYDPTGSGNSEGVYYSELSNWLSSFPSCVKIRIFIDACCSGAAIADLKKLEKRGGKACELTIMTATDATRKTPGGQGGWIDTATEDFMEGANKDHSDANTTKGDLRDRFDEMQLQGKNYGKPQLYMRKGQKEL